MAETIVRFQIPLAETSDFCQRWGVAELSLFGSVLRDDFKQDSDIDVLFRFLPGVRCGLLGLAQMREELETLFGREVDLVSKSSIERSQNWIRRSNNILSAAQVIYAAG